MSAINFIKCVCCIQEYQTAINEMVAEYERTHPEKGNMQPIKG